MGPGVVADFMAFRDHLADDLRVGFGVFADEVEGGFDVAVAQHFEQARGVGGVGTVVEGHGDDFLGSLDGRIGEACSGWDRAGSGRGRVYLRRQGRTWLDGSGRCRPRRCDGWLAGCLDLRVASGLILTLWSGTPWLSADHDAEPNAEVHVFEFHDGKVRGKFIRESLNLAKIKENDGG